MNKQTKMIIGVGVVAVAGYLIYKQQQKKPAAFSGGAQTGRERIMNASGRAALSSMGMGTAKVKPCKDTPAGTKGCGCSGTPATTLGAEAGTMAGTSVFINPNAADGNTIHYCCGKVPGDCAGAN
jgi:hypothetical protein